MSFDLYLVRHGETESNRLHRFGRDDDPLTRTGREQARELSRSLAGFCPDRFLVSPLVRAVESASLIGEAFGLDATREERVQEARVGVFQGLSWDQAREIHPQWTSKVARTRDWSDVPGAESFVGVRQRALDWVTDLGADCSDGERVLVVTHGGFLNSLLAEVLDLSGFYSFRNAALSRLRWGEEGVEVVFIDRIPGEFRVRTDGGSILPLQANEKGPAEAEPFP